MQTTKQIYSIFTTLILRGQHLLLGLPLQDGRTSLIGLRLEARQSLLARDNATLS